MANSEQRFKTKARRSKGRKEIKSETGTSGPTEGK